MGEPIWNVLWLGEYDAGHVDALIYCDPQALKAAGQAFVAEYPEGKNWQRVWGARWPEATTPTWPGDNKPQQPRMGRTAAFMAWLREIHPEFIVVPMGEGAEYYAPRWSDHDLWHDVNESVAGWPAPEPVNA